MKNKIKSTTSLGEGGLVRHDSILGGSTGGPSSIPPEMVAYEVSVTHMNYKIRAKVFKKESFEELMTRVSNVFHWTLPQELYDLYGTFYGLRY
jgi:hypothetical protein